MDDLYRDEILEHYRQPHNFGTLPSHDAVFEGSNPLCGDRITIQLALSDDGVVRDVAFQGRGCAISQASASLLTDSIRGRSLPEVAALTNQDVLDLLGIEISPARLKCAMLSHDSLQHVLQDVGATTDVGAITDAGATTAAPAAGTPAAAESGS
jgi:nitrogen fixation NifU-like protein